jgi:hypothetical protein
MNVAPEIIAALCRKHAPDLLTPVRWQGTPLDKVRLLWGLAGVESSFGLNCTPRHEPGYCFGGRYFNPVASRAWGCLSHCSFGPWQVMFANFPYGVSPLSLIWETDGRVAAEICVCGAVRYLNGIIARGAQNLSEVVIGYNGPANEEEYTAKLAECRDRPMPESSAVVEA